MSSGESNDGDADEIGIAVLPSMETTQKHSRRGDLVLVRIADELHFGIVVYVTHYCPWTNAPLKHGTIIGAEVPTILNPKRVYFFEPFETDL